LLLKLIAYLSTEKEMDMPTKLNNGAPLTRIKFSLADPTNSQVRFSSTSDPGWRAVYDAVVEALEAEGRRIHVVLDPALVQAPLGKTLVPPPAGGGADAEAEAWIGAFVSNAAEAVTRYHGRVTCFEALTALNRVPDDATRPEQTKPAVHPAWYAKVINGLRGEVGDGGGSPTVIGGGLLGLQPDSRDALGYVQAVYTAGRSRMSWPEPAPSPMDAWTVRAGRLPDKKKVIQDTLSDVRRVAANLADQRGETTEVVVSLAKARNDGSPEAMEEGRVMNQFKQLLDVDGRFVVSEER
jgi:hypothetical protein